MALNTAGLWVQQISCLKVLVSSRCTVIFKCNLLCFYHPLLQVSLLCSNHCTLMLLNLDVSQIVQLWKRLVRCEVHILWFDAGFLVLFFIFNHRILCLVIYCWKDNKWGAVDSRRIFILYGLLHVETIMNALKVLEGYVLYQSIPSLANLRCDGKPSWGGCCSMNQLIRGWWRTHSWCERKWDGMPVRLSSYLDWPME